MCSKRRNAVRNRLRLVCAALARPKRCKLSRCGGGQVGIVWTPWAKSCQEGMASTARDRQVSNVMDMALSSRCLVMVRN